LPRLYEQVVFNLVIIVLVLVLVLVLEIRILWVPRDEDKYDDQDDEDDLNTLLRETAVAGPTLFLR
jgi:hypothetical protein